MTSTFPEQNKQIIFKQDPGSGWVDESHMDLAFTHVPKTLKAGQVLLQNLYLSVDPYMRMRMNTVSESYFPAFQLGKPLQGAGIAKIIASENDNYKIGDIVATIIGWEEYTIVSKESPMQKINNELNFPLTHYLGILGMPGATAYHGFINIGEPKQGETVFVSGAAGAVGLVVGQLAKLKGCRVIGSAGSDEKVQALVNEFGFDAAFNYKIGNLSKKLKELCPNGIDIYFDNVGGETLDTVLLLMNTFGRLVECGMISQYNESKPYRLQNLFVIVGKQLKLQGFIISGQISDPHFMKKFFSDMSKWLNEGKFKYTQTITEGIENAPSAFIGMLKGQNTGKQIVQIIK
jgi:NADPH-dependent curcumin reductase CurA